MTRWQDPKIQQLLADLSADGMSAQRIADQLGLTRDSVASAMSRYQLYATNKPGRRHRPITLAGTVRKDGQ
jgi:hypothetical protein